MDTNKIYLTIDEAIAESKKEHGLIPSEFLATFPNNFGINLCAVKGFNVEITDDNQYKSITINFAPTLKKLDEPYLFIVEDNWNERIIIIKSEFDLDDKDVTEFLNSGKPEDDWDDYEIMSKIPESKIKVFA